MVVLNPKPVLGRVMIDCGLSVLFRPILLCLRGRRRRCRRKRGRRRMQRCGYLRSHAFQTDVVILLFLLHLFPQSTVYLLKCKLVFSLKNALRQRPLKRHLFGLADFLNKLSLIWSLKHCANLTFTVIKKMIVRDSVNIRWSYIQAFSYSVLPVADLIYMRIYSWPPPVCEIL